MVEEFNHRLVNEAVAIRLSYNRRKKSGRLYKALMRCLNAMTTDERNHYERRVA